MAGSGITTVNFGSFPGSADASAVITGLTDILSNSKVDAWIEPAATADHSIDEHCQEPLRVFARDIVVGTGFTIYAAYVGTGDTRAYGLFSVGWAYA